MTRPPTARTGAWKSSTPSEPRPEPEMPAMSASALRTLKLVMMMLAALGASPAWADPSEDVPVVHAAGSGDLESRVGRLENLVQSNGLLDLLSEVRQLRGQIETQSHQMDELSARQARLYDDLERRLQALDHGGPPGAAAAAPPPANPPLPTLPAAAAPIADQAAGSQAANPQNPQTAAPSPSAGSAAAPAPGTAPAAGSPATQGAAPAAAAGAPAAAAATVAALAPAAATPQNAAGSAGGNPDQDYKQALELLKRNRYDEAIAVLNNFLVSYPNHPNAESAEYWLGEAYYVSKQYPAAISEF